MRIPRICIHQQLKSGGRITVSGQQARHVTQVLRLRAGSPLRVFDGKGHEFEAVFVSGGRSGISIEIGEAVSTLREPGLHIRLAQGIARNDRMDLILQKSVELGVSEIQPIWMQRSQSHLRNERLEKRIRHWHGVIASACEQSGRATLPVLHRPLPCGQFMAEDTNNGLRIMLQPGSPEILARMEKPAGTVTLLVGPEGGMNDDERGLATAAGYIGVQLGNRILRTETAALAALSGIQTLWGDFCQEC